jgi:hypothetical protein
MSRRDGDVYANTKFTRPHYKLLKWLSENLHVTFSDAVELSLIHGLVSLARGAWFFTNQIEASPGSRLAADEIWVAFQQWCLSRRYKGQISVDDFALMGHGLCELKNIAVRIRSNQAFCLDVRLRHPARPNSAVMGNR